MFCAYFTSEPVHNLADAMKSDRERFKKYFHGMLAEGIYLAPSQFEAGFISTAHTAADIEQTVRGGGEGDEGTIAALDYDCTSYGILAIDHGTKRIGIAVSDELKMIAQPLEYIPAEPFAGFLERLKELLQRERGGADPRRHAAQHGRQLRPRGAEGPGFRRGVEGAPSACPSRPGMSG